MPGLNPPSTSPPLTALPAREAVRLLQRREVSPLELVEAALERIAEVDPLVNAVPTLCADRARERARLIGEAAPPEERGWLAGLPVVIKDLVEVAGVRTTHGSPIFADHVPGALGLRGRADRGRGRIVLGKSNTPEFGAGANTFNEVFGATRNPWNTRAHLRRLVRRRCGGVGHRHGVARRRLRPRRLAAHAGRASAASSACGRASAGCRTPSGVPFATLSVEGPMARDVRGLGAVASTPWPARPARSAELRPVRFLTPKRSEQPSPARVAFSADLGGITPVDPEIAAIGRQGGPALRRARAPGRGGLPDLGPAVEVFRCCARRSSRATWRRCLPSTATSSSPRWSGTSSRGEARRRRDRPRRARARPDAARMAAFLGRHDLLLCPAAIVPPFPVETRYLEELNGHRFPSYIDWVAITYAITLTGCPALSLPCGFTAGGLPVGVQMVGPPRRGQAARRGGDAGGCPWRGGLLPIDPRTAAAA